MYDNSNSNDEYEMSLIDPLDDSLDNPLGNLPKNIDISPLANVAQNNSISSMWNNSSTSSVLNTNTNYNTIIINLDFNTNSNQLSTPLNLCISDLFLDMYRFGR